MLLYLPAALLPDRESLLPPPEAFCLSPEAFQLQPEALYCPAEAFCQLSGAKPDRPRHFDTRQEHFFVGQEKRPSWVLGLWVFTFSIRIVADFGLHLCQATRKLKRTTKLDVYYISRQYLYSLLTGCTLFLFSD